MASPIALLNVDSEPGQRSNPATRQEQWTGDILRLMVVVILAAVILILSGVIAGLFTLQATLPVYILLGLVAPAWWGSRKGGWRWARYFPGLICCGFGFYSSIVAGVNTHALFYALAVLLTGMLISRRAQWTMVIVSVGFMTLVTVIPGSVFLVENLGRLITSSFLLVGISLLQWYYDRHLSVMVSDLVQTNEKLSCEVELRQQAEAILTRREARLRRVTENTTDLICEIALDGTICYASPSYQLKLGFSPEILIGTSVFDLIVPEDRPKARQTGQDTFTTRQTGKVELRCVHKDGHLVDFEILGTPVVQSNGELDGIVLFSRDVTQQKQAEAALRESEGKFRAIIYSIPMGMQMYALREDGKLELTGYNPAADRILRIEHSGLVGKTIEQAFPGLIGTGIPTAFCEVARSGVPWKHDQMPYSNGRINGTYAIQAFQAAPNKVVTLFQDITARIKTAEALRLSDEKFAKAFTISPDSISINRLEDGLYLDVNPSFCQQTGYTREDVIGRTTLEIDIWGNPADRMRVRKALTETGMIDNLEVRFRLKNGTLTTSLFSARLLEINGEECILSFARDITERIHSEQALREAHTQLEDAYEATLQGWVRALELREHETADHSRRVVELTLEIAKEFRFGGESLTFIQRGALLHDIGKIGVPDNILLKPGPLTAEEWTIMRYHPRFAYELISQIPYLARSVDIPSCHHERWDGTGYPRGIAKEKIPLAARIFTVVDVYDALLSNRPYRPAWSGEDVTRYLIDQKGKQFDPLIVDCFMALIQKGVIKTSSS